MPRTPSAVSFFNQCLSGLFRPSKLTLHSKTKGTWRADTPTKAVAALSILCVAATANAAIDARKLSRDQAVRDSLFKNLKAATTEYTFDYVVIVLPPGKLPGINVAVPVSHVRFSSTVFFAFDQYSLQPSAERVLADLADTVLKDKGMRSLLIVGHTDSVGNDDYNSTLSLNRAVTVAKKLREAGVKEDVLGVVPMGEAQPAASNSTPEGRARNRRVEFFISDLAAASHQVIQEREFNPCHRNDHPSGAAQQPSDCANVNIQVPVYPGSAGQTRPQVMLDLGRKTLPSAPTPPRERLPTEILQRPSLKELLLQ
jgi:outer membrane protein OmpA-like peptidoglycan-associated protein